MPDCAQQRHADDCPETTRDGKSRPAKFVFINFVTFQYAPTEFNSAGALPNVQNFAVRSSCNDRGGPINALLKGGLIEYTPAFAVSLL